MKIILWIGTFPLFYGLKLLWNWTYIDFKQWNKLNDEYKRALPIRIITVILLISIGLYLFFGVGYFLHNKY